ncbi:MAG TPA: ATP citrate lyase citrate-binding domain-containing protein [Patescibacteria group bacterium]|nr:ATP citrate lyase citrate-binding domain-containing protein [Patescibacteria group bacterium]
MARKKLSEYTAKKLLYHELGLPYAGLSVSSEDEKQHLNLDNAKKYVIKVDEGVKKRMKNGLVALNKSPQEIPSVLSDFVKKGYTHAIIEPFFSHEQSAEKYLSFERTREGIVVLYSEKGGIDIEDNQESIKRFLVSDNDTEIQTGNTSVDKIVKKILPLFDKYFFSFLEINPLVIETERYYFLDVAAQVDSSGAFFVEDAWTTEDFREGQISKKTEEEKEIDLLSQKSRSSFKLNVLNADGSVFMLLSGGGASIVLADEVDTKGFGAELANYGEYSGNPKAEEVYLYTNTILSLLLRSKAKKKVLIIAGGVANFTDIRITFSGIIKALDEQKEALQKQGVKVFVRRGGPHQVEGLAMMEQFLTDNQLYGFVSDQTTSLPDIVGKAVTYVKH